MSKKKFSLYEHYLDIEDYFYATTDTAESDIIWMIAYDRWLNNKELLSVEEGVKYHPVTKHIVDNGEPVSFKEKFFERRYILGKEGKQ